MEHTLLAPAVRVVAVPEASDRFRDLVCRAFCLPLLYHQAPPYELPDELVQVLPGKTEKPADLLAGRRLLPSQVFKDFVFRPHR